MNRKLSARGTLFLKKVKPFVTIIGWLTFILASVFVIMESYSILKGILVVISVQLAFGILYLVGMGLFLSLMEKKWNNVSETSLS